MSAISYTSGNLAIVPQTTKDRLLEIYTKASENLQNNVDLLRKIPNFGELARNFFLSCLNSQEQDNFTVHTLSDDLNIYAFCIIQFKGTRDGKDYYKLSSLTVNPEFKGSGHEKTLITNIISKCSESSCIYGFVPKSFENAAVYFSSLYKLNEISSSSDDFPEDPTDWLDDNGKTHLPINSWNCFWYPKKL